MELSQSRSCGAQGAKSTHDFLSLYSPPQQDRTPTIPGDYLKTQDFLQPLERVEKEHILPGGIGTYSINHISYINKPQKVPKPERVVATAAQSSSSDKNAETSNGSSSYTGSDFVFWEEQNFKKRENRKVVTSNPDQKPNTPRSKHSATEQRRRSKINDRFLMLRELIPRGDQKRDKASFLLEVVEYIQFLQEKVHKYEDLDRGWSNEPPNTIPLNDKPTEDFIDHSQLPNGSSVPTFVFSSESDKNNSNSAPIIPTNNTTIDSLTGQHPQFTNKPSPFIATSKPQPHLQHTRSWVDNYTVTNDKLKDQELITESGTISISAVYSQGLSSALTHALRNSGVDLTHANISVQIDLGKGSNTNTCVPSTSFLQKNESCTDEALNRSRIASTCDENREAFKRLKRSTN